MALDLGAVKGYIILDDSQFKKAVSDSKKGTSEITGSFGKMTASFFTAQTAFNLASKALTGLINIGKQAVVDWKAETAANAKLGQVIKSTGGIAGVTTKEAIKLANSLQKLTGIEDATIKSAEHMLLTFTNISKDVFPDATEIVLDMGEAFGNIQNASIQVGKALNDPIQGVTALRRVGVQLSDEQEKQIRNFMNLNDISSAQKIILAELQKEFGGLAQKMGEVDRDRLMRSIWGDISEQAGKYIDFMRKDFVETMISAGNAINDFVNSARGSAMLEDFFAKISAGLTLLGKTGADLGQKSLKLIVDQVNKITPSFKKLADNGVNLNTVLSISMTVFKGVSVYFKALIQYLGSAIQLWADFASIAQSAGKLIFSVFQAIFNPSKWAEAKKNFDALKDGFVTLAKNAANNVMKIAETTIDGVKEVMKGSDKEVQSLLNTFDNLYTQKKNLFNQAEDEITNKNKQEIENRVADDTDYLKEWQKIQDDKKEITFKSINELAKKYKEAGADAIKVDKWQWEEKANIAKSTATEIIGHVSNIASTSKELANSFHQYFIGKLEDNLEAMKEADEKEIEELQTQSEERINNVNDEYEEKRISLKDDLDHRKITQEEYDAAINQLEADKANKTKEIQENLANKMAETRKKQLEKQNEEAKKVFMAEKANKIANIWMSWAIGVMTSWSSLMSSPGGIAGIALGAVMTALLTALAVASTVTVATQQFVPMKAKGGAVSAGQPYIVGELGAEIFTPTEDGTILPNSLSNKILENTGSKQIVNNYNVNITGNTISNMMDLNKIANYVISAIGKKMAMEL